MIVAGLESALHAVSDCAAHPVCLALLCQAAFYLTLMWYGEVT